MAGLRGRAVGFADEESNEDRMVYAEINEPPEDRRIGAVEAINEPPARLGPAPLPPSLAQAAAKPRLPLPPPLNPRGASTTIAILACDAAQPTPYETSVLGAIAE